MPLIAAKNQGLPILELGCGTGRDAKTLSDAGHRVIGIDACAAAIAEATVLLPAGEFHCQDMRNEFPASGNNVNVILASLCLHYFPWHETVGLVRRIGRALRPHGLLLCRVNSTDDHNFGAYGHDEIDVDYFCVDGTPKRFFDRAAVTRLFGDDRTWRILHLQHALINRYSQPKAVWELALEKAA